MQGYKKAGFSGNFLTRLKRNQYISMESIESICCVMDCGVDDILDLYRKIHSMKREEIGIVQFKIDVDIMEEDILLLGNSLLKILLQDKTTKKNIIWATSDYEKFGFDYGAKSEITVPQITGIHAKVIQPRITKAKEHQTNRTRAKAEVFTPSWICNEQNNLVDEQWFGRKNVFNIPTNGSWKVVPEQIIFPKEKRRDWMAYVDARRMEITCGEAPYLVSRYDSVSGAMIDIERRIGLLDRKLRVINENTDNEDNWFKWTLRAFQSIYGYEYQGDNLLLARENLLYTFVDNMMFKLNRNPTFSELQTIANVISWNIWQMDGITCTVPFGKIEERYQQMNIFDFMSEQEHEPRKQQMCRITDWRSKVTMTYKSLLEGDTIG